jgi:L-lactate utilization protein LutB
MIIRKFLYYKIHILKVKFGVTAAAAAAAATTAAAIVLNELNKFFVKLIEKIYLLLYKKACSQISSDLQLQLQLLLQQQLLQIL